ncbi:hypothetical protein JRD95_00100 [Rickettsia parkeri]|nr:hypothetical protein RPAGB_0062 [Rickettsia parkeri str. Grand Bay]QWB86058.1 hypothetical protein JRD95_00100 [Rickettsia parkeri]
MIEITMSNFELYDHRAINSYNTVVNNIYRCKIII